MTQSIFRQKNAYADDLGVSPGVVEGWIRRYWEKGVHYTVVGHQTLINTEEADAWLAKFGQKGSGRVGVDSGSGSGEKGGSSTQKRSSATPTMQVISKARLSAANTSSAASASASR